MMNKSKYNQSKFIEEATFRIKNKKWLRYSSNISRRILAAIEDNQEISREVLAERMNVTMQYVSKLVQGNENLSLQTIAKISEALGVELITFPEYKYSTKQIPLRQFTSDIEETKDIVVENSKSVRLYCLKGGKSYDSNTEESLHNKAS